MIIIIRMNVYILQGLLSVLLLAGMVAGQSTTSPTLMIPVDNLHDYIKGEITRQMTEMNADMIKKEVMKQVKETNEATIKAEVTRQVNERSTTDKSGLERLERKVLSVENNYVNIYRRLATLEKCENCQDQINNAWKNINETIKEEFREMRNMQALTTRNITEKVENLERLTGSIKNDTLNIILPRMDSVENVTKQIQEDLNLQQNITDRLIQDNNVTQRELNETQETLTDTRSFIRSIHPGLDVYKDLSFTKDDGTFAADCSELFTLGERKTGVYQIQPRDSPAFPVYCDMTDGGWTIFMRRYDGSQDFYLSWYKYKQGFGSVYGEYWLGNNYLYYLTNKKNYTMKMEYTLFESGESYYVQYSTFRIESESNNYRLTVSGHSGTDRDTWSYHNKLGFTTKDRDNDRWSSSCGNNNSKGGFWYNKCHNVNPTGLYKPSGFDSIIVNTNKGRLSASKMILKIKVL